MILPFYLIMNKYKQIVLLTILMSMIGTKTIAQTLVLHHANGTTTDVELLTQPQVRFQDDKVLITSSIINMEFPKNDVLTFTFKGNESGIKSPNVDINVTQKNGQIIFHGIKPLEVIEVYNTRGIRVPVNIQRFGDNAKLSLSSIPSGVYLLNVNGRTTKFTKP